MKSYEPVQFLPMLAECALCPRNCGTNRLATGPTAKIGFCKAKAGVEIARAGLHMWEEPCISGSRGSGTVFFSHCNLRCVFCQNYQISHEGFGKPASLERLAEIFLALQTRGAHNINLVSPTHFIPQAAEALALVKQAGLAIPVVYNSNAYESVEALRRLEGLIDVYLPDLKYFNDSTARRYSAAPGYFAAATAAILEMFRQVGPPEFASPERKGDEEKGDAVDDGQGLIQRGLIIRHLVLPGLVGESKRILDWIRANLPSSVYVSLMSQYTPLYKACQYPEINRPVSREEYDEVVDYFLEIGLENGYMQEPGSATGTYIPDFNLEGV
ncbi:MAG: radical SAM protein [Firmicutes bacterium]|nr:radical SAM protein [Bacillota bacterium]